MGFFEDRIAPITLSSVRLAVTGLMQAAGLAVTNWRVISVANQMLEGTIAYAYTAVNIIPATVRGFASLDTSSDPGDEDLYDPTNKDLPAEDGFLSALGAGTFGTVRQGETYATGFGTFTNAGPGSRVLAPGGLVFTWTGGTPPSPAPTYTNADDDVIYSGGTVTVPAGTTIEIPIVAHEKGSRSSAPTSTLSLTTSLVGCSFTNDLGPVVGNDREEINAFKRRCRAAPARVSLGGPAAAYEYLAAKNLDGTPLLNVTGAQVGITRVQVTQQSDVGFVTAYYASGSGAAIPDDVTAANENIRSEAMAVPDAITFTGVSATPLAIPVAGTARIKARPGLTAAIVITGILESLTENGQLIPIGGLDQVGGAGVVYREDFEAFARAGYPGLYAVVISLPASASVAVPAGNVPVLTSTAGDWTVTLVP